MSRVTPLRSLTLTSQSVSPSSSSSSSRYASRLVAPPLSEVPGRSAANGTLRRLVSSRRFLFLGLISLYFLKSELRRRKNDGNHMHMHGARKREKSSP